MQELLATIFWILSRERRGKDQKCQTSLYASFITEITLFGKAERFFEAGIGEHNI